MTFTTENAAEMRAKRGRPPAAEKITAPHMTADENDAAERITAENTQRREKPSEAEVVAKAKEAMVSVILVRGWWPADGTTYFSESGEELVYKTPIDSFGRIDEMARKRDKDGLFGPDTRVVVPYSTAKRMVNSGVALIDRSM